MTTPFTTLFIAAFLLSLAVRLWLTLRHIRFVAAHRAEVPAEFAARIPLAAHQKAADYSVDRSRFALQTTLVDSALLMFLTLGGGLAWLHDLCSARLDGLPYGLALRLTRRLVR